MGLLLDTGARKGEQETRGACLVKTASGNSIGQLLLKRVT